MGKAGLLYGIIPTKIYGIVNRVLDWLSQTAAAVLYSIALNASIYSPGIAMVGKK